MYELELWMNQDFEDMYVTVKVLMYKYCISWCRHFSHVLGNRPTYKNVLCEALNDLK